MRPFRFLSRAALFALASAAYATGATPPAPPVAPPASRLVAVKLYPGVAQMQRVLSLSARAREAVFACLPAQIDAASVQASGSPGVQVGELALTRQPRAAAADACDGPLDARIRELQTRIAALDAEDAGIGYALNYFESFGPAGHGERNAAGASIAATAAALRQQGQRAMQDRLGVQRERDRLKAERDALLAQRDQTASGGGPAQVSTVRVTLAAPPQGGQLRLTYQVRGPGWQPGYRAELDTGARRIKLTRLALVKQNTGEDWRDVALTLSTGRPNAATQGRLPPPWRVDIAPPLVAARAMAAPMMAPALPASAHAAEKASAEEEDDTPDFTVTVTDARYATEFAVPQRISVPSGGGQIALALDGQTRPATLLARTAPAQEAAAYLVATVATADTPGNAQAASADLAGIWPPGPVQLYRDGAYAGAGQFDAENLARLGLSFGRDERVTVRAETPGQQQGEAGFMGSRNERRVTHAYVVENHHAEPVTLQVLDAAPVAGNDQISITSHYQPEPQTTRWLNQPGQVLWQQPLAPGASGQFTAEHVITWPKDARVTD